MGPASQGHELLPSPAVVEATGKTSEKLAGTILLTCFDESFPAATTTLTPASYSFLTATCMGSSSAGLLETGRPRLMLTTRIAACWKTQSRPAMTSESDPLPEASRTFTQYSVALGATPMVPIWLSIAATIPETWVPCPLLSWHDEPPMPGE